MSQHQLKSPHASRIPLRRIHLKLTWTPQRRPQEQPLKSHPGLGIISLAKTVPEDQVLAKLGQLPRNVIATTKHLHSTTLPASATESVAKVSQAGADRQPVRLSELFRSFREQFPDLQLGSSEDSYNATQNFYTINMKSRWNRQIPEKNQPWVREPLFRRASRGHYMLLTPAEIGAFQRAWASGNPLVRADEFELEDLKE